MAVTESDQESRRHTAGEDDALSATKTTVAGSFATTRTSEVLSPRARDAVSELVRQHGSTVIVEGDCMAPRIRQGERVTLEPVSWPLLGDIVAVRDPAGQILVHRCVGYRPLSSAWHWAIVTQADDAAVATSLDPYTPVPAVLGRAIAVDQRRLRVSMAERLRALARFCRLCTAFVIRRLTGGDKDERL